MTVAKNLAFGCYIKARMTRVASLRLMTFELLWPLFLFCSDMNELESTQSVGAKMKFF